MLNNVKIGHKILLPLVAFLLGYAAYGFISYQTLKTVQVKGPLYNNIVQGKDLIADILPPPEYIIEAYLVCHLMLEERDSDTLNLLIKKGEQLKVDYDTRHEYWIKDLPESEMKQIFLRNSYDPALKFFEMRDSQFIPAVLGGDKTDARKLLAGPLKQAYQAHRVNIDKVVELATQRNATDESTAIAVIKSRTYATLAVAVAMALIALITGLFVAKNITDRIKLLCTVANRIAVGDISWIGSHK